MNKTRRKAISELRDKLAIMQTDLENVRDEEQAAFDSMAENLKGSQRGENMEQACSDLEDAVSSIQDAIDYLNNASA